MLVSGEGKAGRRGRRARVDVHGSSSTLPPKTKNKVLHTSAGLTINENASPDVLTDLNVSLKGGRREGRRLSLSLCFSL